MEVESIFYSRTSLVASSNHKTPVILIESIGKMNCI